MIKGESTSRETKNRSYFRNQLNDSKSLGVSPFIDRLLICINVINAQTFITIHYFLYGIKHF